MLDEDEDRDIQEMILSHSEETEGDAEQEAAESPASEPAGPAPEPDSGTAEVRERGGRYPHRGVSRRMRRRPRNGSPAGST